MILRILFHIKMSIDSSMKVLSPRFIIKPDDTYGKAIYQIYPDNTGVLELLLPNGLNLLEQFDINIQHKLTDIFQNVKIAIITKYGSLVNNAVIPRFLINDNIILYNDFKLVIEVINNNKSQLSIQQQSLENLIPKLEKLCVNEYICHGFDISNTINKFSLRSYFTCRYETVKYLDNILEEFNTALVRAPPYCGKSVLLSFLFDYLTYQNKINKSNRKIIMLDGLKYNPNDEIAINYTLQYKSIYGQNADFTSLSYKRGLDNAYNKDPNFHLWWKNQTGDDNWQDTLSHNPYILIDEAQNMYGTCPGFWAALKDISQNIGKLTPRVLIVAY
jgi:hypothetical protein